jgi:magnesium-transporting ATPase (P-type)
MGLVGTDVARKSRMDPHQYNFSTIAARSKKDGRFTITCEIYPYIFSSNVPEILPFIMTALLTPAVMPLALGVKQILAIDLGTDLFPALALGSEIPERDVMQRPPRRKVQSLVDGRLLRRSFLWLGLLEAILCSGFCC